MPSPETRSRDEERALFSVEDTEHAVAKELQPKFIARGGEHVVYALPGHPEMVVKVPVDPLRTIMERNAARGTSMDTVLPEEAQQAEQWIAEQRERFVQLRTYFGAEHVLGQRTVLHRVPMPERIAKAIMGDLPRPAGNEAMTLVTLQRRADLLERDHLSCTAGYAENTNPDAAAYARLTQRLVFGKESSGEPVSHEELLAVQNNQELRGMLERAAQEPGLRDALREFASNAIRYTQETGEILDLAGKDNVAFGKRGDVWTYQLVDALYPGGALVGPAHEALHKDPATWTDPERNWILNTMNYVRTIHGIASVVGASERMKTLSEDVGVQERDWLSLLRTT